MAKPVDPDTAIALRRALAYPPVRVSVFEDPADEKSSHGSQRYSGLVSHLEDRDPSWYEPLAQEFFGMDRVLDLGAGSGLALRELSAHGVREPIGIDRWQGFLEEVEGTDARLILHDLTLPMPFLRSGSFDGVFSHFALEYLSPIGVEQVLREASRLLVPGGLLALHLSAAGLVLGDRVRTTPYDGPAFTRMLASAGFEDIALEQPDTRRIIIARARGPGPDRVETGGRAGMATVLEHEADGELQVAAGFRAAAIANGEPSIFVEVSDDARAIDYRPRLAPVPEVDGSEVVVDLSLCLRLVPVLADQYELQAWTWQGSRIAAVDVVPLPMRPKLLRVRVEGAVEHHEAWHPRPPMVEELGDAYADLDHLSPVLSPDDEWHVRGRQVIVEREGDDRDVLRAATRSRDHFVVQRPDPVGTDFGQLEEVWRAGELHGIVLELEDALRPRAAALLSWAALRGLLLYLEPVSWDAIEPAVGELPGSLGAPLLMVDPILSGRAEGEAEVEGSAAGLARALDASPGLHLVLGPAAASNAGVLAESRPARMLLGGIERSGPVPFGDRPLLDEATENLRYLLERTTLIWLRASSGRTGIELGRYGPVTAFSGA
jgi:SAM-dependent methyltransferase